MNQLNKNLTNSATRELRKIKPNTLPQPNTLYEQLLAGETHLLPKKRERSPLKMLDAPNVLNNSQFSILDWSSFNIIALALHNNLFLRNFNNGTTQLLRTLKNGIYTSVVFFDEILAYSTDQGELVIMDSEQKCQIQSHNLNTIAYQQIFKDNLLFCATKNKGVILFDLRQRRYGYQLGNECYHTICIKNELIAVGNQDIVNVWDIRNPKIRLSQKYQDGTALDWSENKFNHLLGGGEQGIVTIWKADTPEQEESIKFNQSITQIISQRQSIICSNGNDINYDSQLFKRHSERVLRMAISPDRKQLCSLGADELLIFWQI